MYNYEKLAYVQPTYTEIIFNNNDINNDMKWKCMYDTQENLLRVNNKLTFLLILYLFSGIIYFFASYFLAFWFTC